MIAVTVIAGVILLLPGLCALLFGGGSLVEEGRIDLNFIPIILIGLFAGALGIVLLRLGIRGRRG